MRRGRRRGRRGDGTITERDGRYLARFSRTEGGKRIRESKTFDLRTDAEWWLSQAKRHGEAPAAMTVAEYMEMWLQGKRNVVESTKAQYTNHVRVHIIPELGGYKLVDLRRRHVEAFVDGRSRHISTGTGRKLSASTVRSILVTLRSALDEAVPREIPDNPAAKVKAPTVRRPPVHALTVEEAGQLVEAVRGEWIEHLVVFLLGSGLRIGEAVALNQGDVQDGFVRLRKSKTSIRAVRVSRHGMEALHEAIRQAPRRGKDEPIFFSPRPNRQGVRDRLDRGSAQHALPRILERAGLRRMTPHGLRHGVATLMLADGVPMQLIAEQLGHRNPGMTAKVYAHVDPRLLREAMSILDEAIDEAIGH
jgi:integrase